MHFCKIVVRKYKKENSRNKKNKSKFNDRVKLLFIKVGGFLGEGAPTPLLNQINLNWK